ncbi:MAG TPA: alpha/beta hydrolase-fold protein [Candidatus Saccharimonadaceae bacterium]|nr:alpha/beta hydrolase-fold protein [Candidatus Saccharimonadaceae bacterium]
MTINLFDVTWVIVAVILLTGGCIFVLRALLPWPKTSKKKHQTTVTRVWILAIGTVLLSQIPFVILQASFEGDLLPYQITFWSAPFALCLIALVYTFKLKKVRILTILLLIPGFSLIALSANDYYQFFSTLSAIFNPDPAVTSTVTHSKDSRNRTPFEAYFQPLPGQPTTGTVTSLDIPSSGSFRPRVGHIYLPPALHGNSGITLPVVVLLSGYPGSPNNWLQGGIDRIMDSYAKAHKGLAPIVAMVDFTGVQDVDTECVNSKLGDVETYLAHDVPVYLRKHYQVQTNPDDWAIGGYSAGGTCGDVIAVRNPNVYRTFFNITGDSYPSLNTPSQTLSVLFAGNKKSEAAHNPTALLAADRSPDYRFMHAWYYMAKQDNPVLMRDTEEQSRVAARAGVQVSFNAVEGHHSFYVWREGFEAFLPWFMQNTNMTN